MKHLNVTNGGPYELSELVDIFADLDVGVLRRCWVACIVDSLTVYDAEIASMAKVLVVVNERLAGELPGPGKAIRRSRKRNDVQRLPESGQ